ncbi:MAG: rod shape-determining protein MreD [Chloroflexi bacterium]|nr:rod shape-determining protein MreD [Chloroflexota bacterium]MCL5108194.1 rod shape-determining protein MreD [Chloroflexota bacterium]
MSPYLGLPLLVFLAGLQGWLAQTLSPTTNLRPELLLLAAVACGLLGGYRAGLVWGALAGLLFDLGSAGPLGAGLICMAAVGCLSGLGQAGGPRFNRLLPLQAAALATIVYDLLYMLLLQLSGWGFNLIVAIYEVALPSALLSLVLMPAVYGPVYWLWHRARPGREASR